VREDFASIMAWATTWKNAETNGLADFDFLAHLCAGCNYADHVSWGLHSTKYIPCNKASVASEAGWTSPIAPDVDPDAAAYPAPACTPTAPQPYDSFDLHVLYNSANATCVAAKAAFVAQAQSIFGAAKGFLSVGVDDPFAFTKPASPMLTAAQTLRINASAVASGGDALFATFMQWAMQADREDSGEGRGFDLVLEPHTGCPYGDLVSRALYVGNRWMFNEHALVGAQLEAAAAQTTPAVAAATTAAAAPPLLNAPPLLSAPPASCKSIVTASSKAVDFIVYLLAGPGNYFQTDALGLTVPDSGVDRAALNRSHPIHAGAATGVIGAAIAKWNLTSAATMCSSQYPAVEPDYSAQGDICLMTAAAPQPYFHDSNPIPVEYAALYVPGDQLRDVATWSMEHRAAESAGYNVGVKIVPLTGCPLLDFTAWSLKAGDDWRLNEAALS
tara:strand:+ start:1051 stop:2385 length:1335 start_codon:yes stop_codon:yes gene_type:complete